MAAAGFAAGDIVFIDSSHVVEEGGEIDRLLLDVLPRLPAGALVHVHDVFLPDGYPSAWAGRRYNEQTAVGALLGGGGWDIVFASRYVATRTALLRGTLVEAAAAPAGRPRGEPVAAQDVTPVLTRRMPSASSTALQAVLPPLRAEEGGPRAALWRRRTGCNRAAVRMAKLSPP